MERRTSRWRWVLLVVLLAALVAGGAWWIRLDAPAVQSVPNPVIGRTTPTESALATPSAAPTPTVPPVNELPRTKPFTPVSVGVGRVGNRPVQALDRILVGDNSFTLPDPEGLDPQVYAWDKQGAMPGASRGAVNLTAHTYPPGQEALGNRLYDQLQVGEFLLVRGDDEVLRYRVTERVEVTLPDYPVEWVLDPDGAPHLTITICSGERRGPGDWTMRTVWYAVPMK